MGLCRITIRDGVVVEVQEPKIAQCPLAKRCAYPIDLITSKKVAENITLIRAFGMCTPERQVGESSRLRCSDF